jgi:hypothetical protein
VKYLIVAHPDDEILWFNPEEYDRIVIVFLGRLDIPSQTEARRRALEQHPLRDRIVNLGLVESGMLRDKSPEAHCRHDGNLRLLCEKMKELERVGSVTTHNAMGEYQHPDHVLVHNACMQVFDCPVNGKDPQMYRSIRKAYKDHGCWTWY